MPQENLEKLRQTVAQLHAELASVEPADREVHGLLESAIADLNAVLDKSATAPAGRPSLVGRLTVVAEHYEHSHPTLSGILGSIIDALSRMGI